MCYLLKLSEDFCFVGNDFRGQVRSQEELNRKETILGSIIDLQVCEEVNLFLT